MQGAAAASGNQWGTHQSSSVWRTQEGGREPQVSDGEDHVAEISPGAVAAVTPRAWELWGLGTEARPQRPRTKMAQGHISPPSELRPTLREERGREP